jgi:bifunctional non-homologous end joining protein LigD
VSEVVAVDGRDVPVSSLDRPLFPAAGWRKQELIGYYLAVADALLPHIRGHPVTLHRFPEGVAGPHFYQTRCPPHPDWVRTATLSYPRTGKTFDVAVLDDRASLVWAANLATVEVHPYLSPADDLAHPRWLVADLDPGAPADVLDAARVALRLRGLLTGLGLPPAVKTSGRKGVHVYALLPRGTAYAASKELARGLATELAGELPDVVVTSMARHRRPGRVLLDWSQNDAGKSTVAPYSLRALPLPGVSTPVTWDEVEAAVATGDAQRLAFAPAQVLDRLARHGDLFAAMLPAGLPAPTAPP